MSPAARRSGTLLYDLDCSICIATAAWLARRVAATRLRLLPLGDAAADPTLAALVEGRSLSTTIHFVRADDTVLTGARALIAAGRLVPGWGFVAVLLDNRVGHRILEPVYRQIAMHRRRIGRLLRMPTACALPPTRSDAT
jgi:predicted DCC family thiol-disulfide oxidoreductase YuxK